MGELAKRNTTQGAIEKVILRGDLSGLTEVERLQYNFALCESLGLNPITRPIDYIAEQGKISPYINAIGVAQLREIHGISTKIIRVNKDDEFVYTTAAAVNRNGRSEEATAIVPLCDRYGKPLTGQHKANAIMKCETKAKRRATLALCGFGDGNGRILKENTPADLLPEEEF
ncbi:MAG: hypothetical protein F6K45_23140 [Kamptonema sp. SIO1D9]|nr:hypothetical protein [Kamptonema sp. SIO1D9]